MEQHEIELIAEFRVVRHWLIRQFAAQFVQGKMPSERVSSLFEREAVLIEQTPTSGLGPEWSDLLSQEAAEAARRFGEDVLKTMQRLQAS